MELGMKTLIVYSLVFAYGLTLPTAVHAQNPESAAKAPDHFNYLPPGREAYLHYANEINTTLQRDILDVWFPRTIDNEHGGFYSDFTRDWQRSQSHGKFSVFQGRMTWIAAQVAMRRPELREDRKSTRLNSSH